MEWHSGPRLPSEGGRYIPTRIRNHVMERDGDICQYCGDPATDADHVYPWSNGGTHHPRNLVASCETCNSIAGLRVFTEFYKKQKYILARRAELLTMYGSMDRARVAELADALLSKGSAQKA
jgi:5-methylcytosine-specific restriction endonuclease McrA